MSSETSILCIDKELRFIETNTKNCFLLILFFNLSRVKVMADFFARKGITNCLNSILRGYLSQNLLWLPK